MSALETNTERVEWSRRYQTALRRYLQRGSSASSQTALKLGRQAVILGLETLDVARLHEQALKALASPASSFRTARQTMNERAKHFFAEAIVPIEATHHAAMKAGVRIDQLTRTLRRRTRASSASAAQLESAIALHQAAELALKKGAAQHSGLLAEARGMQKHLQHQMRAILSAQEDEREYTSRELRNEIAQVLLAIDLSLLALKASADANTGGLEKEIANAQRLVGQLDRGSR